MQSENIKALNLIELLNSEEQYIIPIYQRNYAWEAKEIEQLIQDVIDYSIHHPDKNYYIGTLVVAAEQNGLNTIDGQQRAGRVHLQSCRRLGRCLARASSGGGC